MLFGVGILCCVSWSIVSYLLNDVADQLPRLGKRKLVFFCYCLHVILWCLFGGGFSSSWYLGWAALFYCGTPWTFHLSFWFVHVNFHTRVFEMGEPLIIDSLYST